MDIQYYMRAGTLQLSELPPLSLYIHLPWCLKKCPYCDFNSHALQPNKLAHQTPATDSTFLISTNRDSMQMQHYLKALEADLDAALPLIWGRQVISIFIGGGTPSLFSATQIDELLTCVRARLPLLPGCEITLEANPGTYETDRFAAYRQAGVTRLSIGVQSFNNHHLEKIGRIHSGEQAYAAVQEAAQAFDTFNLDIMYALPSQTLKLLEQDLNTALSLRPPHLSVYHLTIEPNTFFAKYPPVTPDDDLAYEMLDMITAMTKKQGLQRYEVSAYARPNQRCIHNFNYWQFGDYLGIGAGAHSKLSFAHRIIRQVRLRDPARYIKAALSDGGQTVISQENEITRKDLPFEFMLNALRLRDGFSIADYQNRTGMPYSSIKNGIEQGLARGLLERLDDFSISPTERGFDFLNELQESFLA